MAVAQTDSEAASFEAGFEIEHPEHPHSILGYGVFFGDDANMAKAHAFNERLDHTMMCYRLMCFGCGRCGHECDLLTRQFAAKRYKGGFAHGYLYPPLSF